MDKTRRELFDLVWVVQMIHLSKQLGLSDVGSRKICIKYSIPPTQFPQQHRLSADSDAVSSIIIKID